MTRTRLAIAAAVGALALAGCGEKCPTESPEVRQIQDCVVAPGSQVTVGVRLCPTCNQVLSSCEVDIQGGTVFLDPVVEACESSAGCPGECQAQPTTCSFRAPNETGTYVIEAFDPNSNGTKTSELVVSASGPYSCAFAPL